MKNIMVQLLRSLLMVGAMPIHRYSRTWEYYPSAILAAILIITALMLFRALG